MSAANLARGRIVRVEYESGVGSEPNKVRPAVVVSNDGVNEAVERSGRGLLVVVPFSTKIARRYVSEVLVTAAESGLAHDSKAKVDQIRAVSPHRVVGRIGWVPAERMAEIDEALRLHLAL